MSPHHLLLVTLFVLASLSTFQAASLKSFFRKNPFRTVSLPPQIARPVYRAAPSLPTTYARPRHPLQSYHHSAPIHRGYSPPISHPTSRTPFRPESHVRPSHPLESSHHSTSSHSSNRLPVPFLRSKTTSHPPQSLPKAVHRQSHNSRPINRLTQRVSLLKKVIIQKLPEEASPSSAYPSLPASTLLGDDYETFPSMPGSRYKLYTHLVPWTEALLYCQADGQGSLLVVINSRDEADVVKEVFARIGNNDTRLLHVGVNDIYQEGVWMTVLAGLDRPLSTAGYEAWQPGQPSGGDADNCGAVNRDAELDDVPCNMFGAPFLCEKPAAVVV